MRLYLTLACLVLINTVFGQTNVSNDTLHWNENRKLKWEDFRGEPQEYSGFIGECFCMNLANFERPNIFSKTTFTVISLFDRTKSWVSTSAKSDIGLVYFQTIFNIYELHARELRKELSATKFGTDPTKIFQDKYNASMTDLMNHYNQFRKETKMGSDTNILKLWSGEVQSSLDSLNNYR
jgi:hypothetical protein